MSDRKGKNVVRNDRPAQSYEGDNSEDATFTRRVFASARGLAASFATPSIAEVGQQIAASGGDGKTQHIASIESSNGAESSTTHNPPLADAAQTTHAATFRDHQQQHIASAEQEFSNFLDNIESLTAPAQQAAQAFDVQDFRAQYPEIRTAPDSQYTHVTEHSDIAHQEAHDGQDVLAILSNNLGTHPEEQWEIYNRSTEEEPIVWQMSKLDRETWQTRLQSDFPETSHEGQRLNTLSELKLMPVQGFDSTSDRHAWVQQWQGVLDRYVDEVWGDMLPLVESARDELDQIKTADIVTSPRKSTALSRLGLLLGQLRDS